MIQRDESLIPVFLAMINFNPDKHPCKTERARRNSPGKQRIGLATGPKARSKANALSAD